MDRAPASPSGDPGSTQMRGRRDRSEFARSGGAPPSGRGGAEADRNGSECPPRTAVGPSGSSSSFSLPEPLATRKRRAAWRGASIGPITFRLKNLPPSLIRTRTAGCLLVTLRSQFVRPPPKKKRRPVYRGDFQRGMLSFPQEKCQLSFCNGKVCILGRRKQRA